ncbi:MAG: ABC transporter ATP-binding protein [Kofleriaceae bacterium]|nr:ABC transporter ATP-binding protein [Myxococcales bacterium]MCB9565272.1 ABC transporter ATP-binding protein [Kofleriaceae bacterium]
MSDAAGGAAGARQEGVLGKAYDLRLMRQLWRFVRPNARLLVAWVILMPLTLGFELAQPYLLKLAIQDHIAVGKPDGLELLAVLYVGLVVLQAGSAFGEQWVLQLLGQRSMHGLRLYIYDHVLRQRAAFFDRMPVGRLLTRMTNDIESINEMFAQGVVTLIADFVKMVAIVVIMLSMDVTMTLMTFLTLPLLWLLVIYTRNAMRRSFREVRVRLAAMNAFVQEHLSGIRVVQLFRREAAATREYDEINAGHRDAYLTSIRADAAMYALVEAIGVLAIAGVAWYASTRLGGGASAVAEVGLVVVFIEYINKFFIPVRDLSAKYAVMQGAMAASERIMELIETDEPDAPPSAAAHPVPADVAGDAGGLVAFRDVTFAYGAGEPVLRGVSFDVPRGATVAVVGATGSGKSTLIKLLTRLYEIDGGGIYVGGHDVRDLPTEELRRRVTVVSQDVFMFNGTVADNLRLGRDFDRARLEDAVRRVGADRVLARRPDGLDGVVTERGGNFSAGERQLLAFARAMAREPEILVLDEATAHVDPEAEELIERGVAELMRGRTTLVIAHRLTTIRNADLILVMSRGQIIERGTHDELIAAGGAYAALERTFRRAGS